MKAVQYQVNEDFPNVYSPIGESYGLIPVRIDGKAMNLHVNNGEWIVYQGNTVGIISDLDFKNGKAPSGFVKLR